MKTVVSVTGIRPDFIRMSEIFKKLDENFNHILVHTGQHFDTMLSDVFFNELEIRKPDYNLEIGAYGKEHFHQTADASVKIIELLRKEHIKPDLILFLGDSNSVVMSVALKKEGYKIGHIEAGMRSGDKRMLEEINRTVCDYCSDIHFVYHEDYKDNLIKENLPPENIHVVGNTIVEVCNKLKEPIMSKPKTKDFILMDIHRPENFKYKDRLSNTLKLANMYSEHFKLPVKMLKFGRTIDAIKEFNLNLGSINLIELMSYKEFLTAQYNCLFLLSDSGTSQEEPALLSTPVIVPRDYTERPQSVLYECSHMLNVNTCDSFDASMRWLCGFPALLTGWLGEGETSSKIMDILKSVI